MAHASHHAWAIYRTFLVVFLRWAVAIQMWTGLIFKVCDSYPGEGSVYCGLRFVFVLLSPYTYTLTEVFPCFFLSCKANVRV
jgi:hypothetical protein